LADRRQRGIESDFANDFQTGVREVTCFGEVEQFARAGSLPAARTPSWEERMRQWNISLSSSNLISSRGQPR